jgi:hypothetical protein
MMRVAAACGKAPAGARSGLDLLHTVMVSAARIEAERRFKFDQSFALVATDRRDHGLKRPRRTRPIDSGQPSHRRRLVTQRRMHCERFQNFRFQPAIALGSSARPSIPTGSANHDHKCGNACDHPEYEHDPERLSVKGGHEGRAQNMTLELRRDCDRGQR